MDRPELAEAPMIYLVTKMDEANGPPSLNALHRKLPYYLRKSNIQPITLGLFRMEVFPATISRHLFRMAEEG